MNASSDSYSSNHFTKFTNKLNVGTTCSTPASFAEIAHLITLHATPIATEVLPITAIFNKVDKQPVNCLYNCQYTAISITFTETR